MAYLIVFLLTLLSCVIFDNLGVFKLVKKLTGSYGNQMKLIANKDIPDEEKQKQLLSLASKQVVMLLKLIGAILLFISPFLLVLVFDEQLHFFEAKILYTISGIGISVVAVFAYILLKRLYVKLFFHRKDSA